MSKNGALFGFILGAGAVAGVIALSKKTETIKQLKIKYASILNEMKDYADMSGKHTNNDCAGDCSHCHAEDTFDKVGDVTSAVSKKVHDILSDKEEFDKLIGIFKPNSTKEEDAVKVEHTDTTEGATTTEEEETIDSSDEATKAEETSKEAEVDGEEADTENIDKPNQDKE